MDAFLECAPDGGPGLPGFQRMKVMAKHRTHSFEFKRRIAQDFVVGETLHALASRANGHLRALHSRYDEVCAPAVFHLSNNAPTRTQKSRATAGESECLA
jgi:hypothetical protein